MKMAVKSIILIIRKSLISRINEVYVFFNKIYRGYSNFEMNMPFISSSEAKNAFFMSGVVNGIFMTKN